MAASEAYKYHTLIQYWNSSWNRPCEQNLDLKNNSRSLPCSNSWRLVRSSFFHTNRFTVFRRMVVSSEKITCFQFVVLFYLESSFPTHFCKHNGFDKSRLYLTAAFFKRRCIVVLSLTVASAFLYLFAMSRAVTNVYCSTSETICSSCLWVVAHAGSDRIKSLQPFDYFHRLSQYFTVVTSHLTAFATASWLSFGPIECWDKRNYPIPPVHW